MQCRRTFWEDFARRFACWVDLEDLIYLSVSVSSSYLGRRRRIGGGKKRPPSKALVVHKEAGRTLMMVRRRNSTKVEFLTTIWGWLCHQNHRAWIIVVFVLLKPGGCWWLSESLLALLVFPLLMVTGYCLLVIGVQCIAVPQNCGPVWPNSSFIWIYKGSVRLG